MCVCVCVHLMFNISSLNSLDSLLTDSFLTITIAHYDFDAVL